MPSKYRSTLIIGIDPETGKKITKSFCAKTKREAIQKRDDYKYRMKHGIATYEFRTFEQVAYEWLDITKDGTVSESTYTGYKFCIKMANAAFGSKAIQSVTASDLNKLIKSHTDKSESYMNKLKITLRAIFKYAHECDYIPKDIAVNMVNLSGKKTVEKEPYTEKEMRAVLDYSKRHKYGLGIFLTLKTGVRCGELMGLKTTDFNLATQRLTIVRTAVNNASSNIIKLGGKTENAVRTIPLDDETIAFLADRDEFDDDRFLFLSSRSGRPIAPAYYARRRHAGFMKDLNADIGIRELNPHYLRHTYGTHLFRLGNDLFKIMKIMGHSSIETTRRIYIHETIEDIENGLILD